ncbi:MAG: nicotinamide mononucleotide transporter [Clostridia bacterium]|nr:nicotinamide mononucleotide transporter [Clostridia bacterium]
MKKREGTSLLGDYIPLSIAALSIIVFGIINISAMATGQKEGSISLALFKLLPTLISPVVLVLTAHANRYGFLLGGFNSLLYAVTFFMEGLFFSLFTAVAVSFPVQVFSFFHWSRNRKDEKSEEVALKTFGVKGNALMILAMAAVWAVCYFLIGDLIASQNYKLFDTIGFVTGMACTFIAAFRYVESMYINVICVTCSVLTWVSITLKDPSSVNYLINSLYSLYTVIQASYIWTKLYVKQKRELSMTREEALHE